MTVLSGATRPTLARLRLMLRPELAHEVSRLPLVLAQMLDVRALPRRWLGDKELGTSIQLVLKWFVRGGESVRGGAMSRTSKNAVVSFSAPLLQMPP